MNRVSHFRRQGSGKEQQMTDTSGPTYGRQFATYDHDSQSWRMWPDTGLWGSIAYSETWPRTGYMSDGQAYELPTSAPPTTASDFSSSPHLPTPTASDGEKERNNPSQARRKSPPLSAVNHLLPTPTASEGGWNRSASPNAARRTTLTQMGREPGVLNPNAPVMPTPTASDATGGGQHPSKRVGHTRQLIDTVLGLTSAPTPKPSNDGSD